jgi:L-LDH-NAD: L-lactate dehydrogenase
LAGTAGPWAARCWGSRADPPGRQERRLQDHQRQGRHQLRHRHVRRRYHRGRAQGLQPHSAGELHAARLPRHLRRVHVCADPAEPFRRQHRHQHPGVRSRTCRSEPFRGDPEADRRPVRLL